MVSSLAGSLALVTCREPLKASVANQLRALLQQSAPAPAPRLLRSKPPCSLRRWITSSWDALSSRRRLRQGYPRYRRIARRHRVGSPEASPNPASTNRSSTRPSCKVGTRLPSRSRSDRDRASFRVPLFAFTTTLRSFRARRLVRRRPLARHRRLLDSRSVSRNRRRLRWRIRVCRRRHRRVRRRHYHRMVPRPKAPPRVRKKSARMPPPPRFLRQAGGAQGQPDPAGLREKVAAHFDEWARVQDLPPTDAASVAFMQRLVDSRLLAEDTQERFLRILVELAVTHCLGSEVPSSTPRASSQLSFAAIDAYVRLVTRLVRRKEETLASRLAFFGRALVAVVRTAMRDTDERNVAFNARPYFRASRVC